MTPMTATIRIERRDFERQQLHGEERFAEIGDASEDARQFRPAGVVVVPADATAAARARRSTKPSATSNDEGRRQRRSRGRRLGPVENGATPLLEQRDDEDEQHENRAGVDDDLHDGQELGRKRDVEHGERGKVHQQRDDAVDGLIRAESSRRRWRSGRRRAPKMRSRAVALQLGQTLALRLENLAAPRRVVARGSTSMVDLISATRPRSPGIPPGTVVGRLRRRRHRAARAGGSYRRRTIRGGNPPSRNAA